MCARRTGDVTRAVALYEAAIADDPSAPGAFEAIEAVLLKNADFSAVARAYERQIERLSGRGETAAEAELCDRLSRLRADRLSDLQGAIVALDRLIVLRPDDVEARARLAALLEQTGELRLAARCLENAAHWAPTRPATFRDLYRICSSLGDLDRSYCSCAVLVHLGEAELDEQRVYQSFAPETTPRPRAALDAQGWQALRTEDHDEVISRIVHAIAPAAIALRVEQLEAARRLPEPARRDRQDVDKSTGMAVRTVPWACAVLGLEVPAVYARNEDIPGGIAHLALPDPTVMLGKALLAGRSVPELAFAIGRELACQELTARLVTFYPTMAELRALIVAAVAQVLPSSLPSDALALRDVLRSRMSPAQRGELEGAVAELEARDGRLDMNRWIRAVEMAACRAGLVVCGDITAAARMLAVDGRVVGGLRAAERIRNLIPFSVSERCAALRKAIGIEARRATARPPGC
jgi:tetratricopeptide (TPR) repeat protein